MRSFVVSGSRAAILWGAEFRIRSLRDGAGV